MTLKKQLTPRVIVPLVFLFLTLSTTALGQTVQRSTFSVFSPADENDSLLVAAGQIMSGEDVDVSVDHGYYPLYTAYLTLPELAEDNQVRLYPNPFAESFWVSTENFQGVTLAVYDLNGAIVRKFTLYQPTQLIPLTDIAKGVYLVKAYTDKEELFNQKIIKQ